MIQNTTYSLKYELNIPISLHPLIREPLSCKVLFLFGPDYLPSYFTTPALVLTAPLSKGFWRRKQPKLLNRSIQILNFLTIPHSSQWQLLSQSQRRRPKIPPLSKASHQSCLVIWRQSRLADDGYLLRNSLSLRDLCTKINS